MNVLKNDYIFLHFQIFLVWEAPKNYQIIERNFKIFVNYNEKGQRFRGGLDEKLRRLWLGRTIVVVDLPPLGQLTKENLIFDLS